MAHDIRQINKINVKRRSYDAVQIEINIILHDMISLEWD